MKFEIGLENTVDGRSIAWVLAHPGCFAYAANGELALAAAPQAISNYAAWIACRDEERNWVDSSQIELYLADAWRNYIIDENFDLAEQGYEVNAWFRYDWKPLSIEDVQRAAKLLVWSRADLLDVLHGLRQEALDAPHPGERWSIAGILKHLAGAEWWYLDRLGLAFPREKLPKDPFERLEKTRAQLLHLLPGLVGSRQVIGVDGEVWSPRKLLRRAVWHERDHTEHISKLIRKNGELAGAEE
jgi:uncharacterized damage-inducible protein DinB